jgi:hypothetical protein
MLPEQLMAIATAERRFNLGLISDWEYYRAVVDSYFLKGE